MRKNKYLNEPEEDSELKSLGSNNLLNSKILNLQEIATKQKTEDIINVMRYNDFESGYTNGASIKVLKESMVDRLDRNFELQIEILIECEEDIESRELIRDYYVKTKDHAEFSEEKFVEDILHKRFTFL